MPNTLGGHVICSRCLMEISQINMVEPILHQPQIQPSQTYYYNPSWLNNIVQVTQPVPNQILIQFVKPPSKPEVQERDQEIQRVQLVLRPPLKRHPNGKASFKYANGFNKPVSHRENHQQKWINSAKAKYTWHNPRTTTPMAEKKWVKTAITWQPQEKPPVDPSKPKQGHVCQRVYSQSRQNNSAASQWKNTKTNKGNNSPTMWPRFPKYSAEAPYMNRTKKRHFLRRRQRFERGQIMADVSSKLTVAASQTEEQPPNLEGKEKMGEFVLPEIGIEEFSDIMAHESEKELILDETLKEFQEGEGEEARSEQLGSVQSQAEDSTPGGQLDLQGITFGEFSPQDMNLDISMVTLLPKIFLARPRQVMSTGEST